MTRQFGKNYWGHTLLLLSCLVGLGCDDSAGDASQSAQTSAPVQSEPVQSEPLAPIQSEPIQSEPIQSAPVQSAPVQSEPIQSAPSRQEPTSSPDYAPAEPAALDRGDVTGGMTAAISGREVKSPLVMETTLEPRDGKWTARWKITNRSEEPVYLVTQLPTTKSGRIVASAGRIYRRVDQSTLHLTKRLWRIPAGVAPLVQELPYLLRLEPGQTSAGAIRVPSSLRESYPYQAGHVTALVRQVVISFGYFTADAEPSPSQAGPGLFEVPYRALDMQRFLTSEPRPARLMVR